MQLFIWGELECEASGVDAPVFPKIQSSASDAVAFSLLSLKKQQHLLILVFEV